MLNELLIVERGVRQAGLEMTERHPDVKDAGKLPTLLVRLSKTGDVVSVQPLMPEVTPWTLRKGQHNSFPFVKVGLPFWDLPPEGTIGTSLVTKSHERREVLLSLANDLTFNTKLGGWPKAGLVGHLQERLKQLDSVRGTDGEVLLATITRFLLACERNRKPHVLSMIAACLIEGIQQSGQDEWVGAAIELLCGRFNKKTRRWECAGALLFEADGAELPITDGRVADSVSQILRLEETGRSGVCNLTGNYGRLLSGNFPQPNLPILGQTYIFAKNKEIPANDRYGRFAAEAISVGQEVAIRLAAALAAVTSKERHGISWRSVPGEVPKQQDLLLAFAESVPEAPVAGLLADDGEEDFSAEAPSSTSHASNAIAVFEKRTERVLNTIRARLGADFRESPVQVAVFRKVDLANRKVICTRALDVSGLYSAAAAWIAGERNLPNWLTIPVLLKGERKRRPMAAPHVAPLSVISFMRESFIRGGSEKQAVIGLPASEVLALFLDSSGQETRADQRRACRILRMVLTRRTALLLGTGLSLRRRVNLTNGFDWEREALRSITIIGVLLHQLGRSREDYVNDTGFRLGQLLAAADAVHVGYCADVRGGDVPPSLLGNQVFAIAQTAPARALAMLSRRWKPYDGWARKARREHARAEKLASSKKREEQQRGWDIRIALRSMREIGPLARDLSVSLNECKVDDVFRAELLLGYIAGLPKASEADDGQSTRETDEGD